MKKHLLLFFAIVSLNCYSQNWKTVKLHQNNFYKCIPSQGNNFSTNAIWNTNAIRIDSAYSVGNDSVFLNFNTIRDTSVFTFPGCVNIHGASWLGSHVIQDSTGVNTFFNSNEDSIKIKTHSQLNDSWHLYNFTNGDYLEATVSSASIQLVIGNVDSVKQITIQCKDSTGTPIANLFNGKDILISKQHGIIKLYDFYNFPNVTTIPLDTLAFNISDSHLMTIGELFDYNVGDEFGSYENCNVGPPSQKLITVMDKHFSTALDTVFYHFQTETSTPFYVALPFPHFDFTYHIDTLLHEYCTNFNQLVCSTMPMENGLIDSATSTLPSQNPAQYSMDDADPSVYCGLESYTFLPGPYFFTSNCPTYNTFESNYQTYRAIKGCGVLQVRRVDNTSLPVVDCFGDLNYIHKGSFVCGTPPSLTVGINNLMIENEISIYPNPFSTQTTITFSEEQKHTIVSITDVLGKEVYHTLMSGGAKTLTIEKGTMQPGIYFVKATDQHHKVSNLKVIVQ